MSSSVNQNLTFPSDLIADNRKYYCDITFMDYSSEQQYNSTPIMRIGGGIKLPLPRKINDFNFQMWEEWSATATAVGVAEQALATAGFASNGFGGGIFGSFLTRGISSSRNFLEQEYGATINPAMFMLYRRPAYKEYELSWLLAASNKKDSDNLKKIIDTMKYNSLPSLSGKAPILGEGALWDYPSLCLVSLTPDKYTFKFRPAVIVSVAVDYHAAGGPSYFNSGAPTVVSLSLRLKEISFWTKDNFKSESSLGNL